MLCRITRLLKPAIVVWISLIALLNLSHPFSIAEPVTQDQSQSRSGDNSKPQHRVPDFELKSADISQVSTPAEAAQSVAPQKIQKLDKKPDANYRLQKIREWRIAVAQHSPGKPDAAALMIAGWQPSDLELVVSFLTSNSAKKAISSASVRRLLQLTDQEVRTKDLSRVLKLGALLHTDVDLLELERGVYQLTSQGFSVTGLFADGRVILQPQRFHWQLARRLMDSLRPEDRMLRQWYIATTAHMQSRRLLGYAGQNLKSALDKFPADERILFYAGALHETWASPLNQNPILPLGGKLYYGSREAELNQAKQFYEKALQANPNFAEARLRFGRVTGLLGQHKRALEELQRAATALQDRKLLYYASLYTGYEFEMLSRPNDARDQYERAANLYPAAQSPLLALSQLAGNSGDSKGALAAVRRVFELQVNDPWKDDPWWDYDVAQARDADALVSEMHAMFGELPR